MTDCAGASPPPDDRSGAGDLRERIATLLADPGVAERVRRRLARSRAPAPTDLAGSPPCLRTVLPARERPAPVLVRGGRCAALCGGVDCLCGRYPPRLDAREIASGRLERLAV